MLRKNAGHELDEFYQKWGGVDEVVIFCFGKACRSHIPQIRGDIKIAAVVDNDPKLQGSAFQGVPVISLEEYLEKYRNVKIVISAYYSQIAAQLAAAGLAENEDFCDMQVFVAAWYWFRKKQVHITRVNISITTCCTLKCKHCNMFMPRYEKPFVIDKSDVAADVDRLFGKADMVYDLALLGGEPFIHPQLNDIISYIGDNYRDNVSTFELITNGTVEPKPGTLELLKKYRMSVLISDYSAQTGMKDKVGKFIGIMSENGIPYEVINSETWLDFGFPDKPWALDDEAARRHFMECFPAYRGLNDGRIYFCHVCWSAEKAGMFRNAEDDQITLDELSDSDEDRVRLLEYCLGFLDKGFLSLCKICGGCGKDNSAVIPAGEQLKGGSFK